MAAGKLKINTKEVNGKTGYQAVGSDGTTTKWWASQRRARAALDRLLRKKKLIKKKKPIVSNDNETKTQQPGLLEQRGM